MRRPSRSYRWKRTSLGCVAGYSRTGSVISPNDRVPVHTAVAIAPGYRGRTVRRKGRIVSSAARGGVADGGPSTGEEELPIADPPAETASALSEIRRDLVVSARTLVASFRNPSRSWPSA